MAEWMLLVLYWCFSLFISFRTLSHIRSLTLSLTATTFRKSTGHDPFVWATSYFSMCFFLQSIFVDCGCRSFSSLLGHYSVPCNILCSLTSYDHRLAFKRCYWLDYLTCLHSPLINHVWFILETTHRLSFEQTSKKSSITTFYYYLSRHDLLLHPFFGCSFGFDAIPTCATCSLSQTRPGAQC